MTQWLIDTPSVCVRRFRPQDAQQLWQALGDEQVMAFIEPPYTLAQTEDFIAAVGLCEPPLVYAVQRKADGCVIGHVIWHSWNGDPLSRELGWILRRDCWGRGLAGEITQALIAHARDTGLRTLVLECDAAQAATRHIALKYGFERVPSDGPLHQYVLALDA